MSELGGLDNQVHHISNQLYSSSQEPVAKSRQHLFKKIITKERLDDPNYFSDVDAKFLVSEKQH